MWGLIASSRDIDSAHTKGEFLNNMANTNDLFLPQEMQKPSSETQGQLVGWIKCPWWKFTVRSRRAPGHLLLPNQFQKRLNCPLLIGQKNFFRPISEEEQPGDCDVFLDAVVAVKENLIDRHSCAARSTGKVSELMLTKPEKLQAFTRLQETNALRWIFNGGSVEGIVNFDTRCATFSFCTFILITSLLPPQGFRPEAKSRGGTLVARTYI